MVSDLWGQPLFGAEELEGAKGMDEADRPEEREADGPMYFFFSV